MIHNRFNLACFAGLSYIASPVESVAGWQTPRVISTVDRKPHANADALNLDILQDL
jgi:hypothetical protein